jgi:8-oxo-dGTP pyrophosphatase MutT (NUDIX family)
LQHSLSFSIIHERWRRGGSVSRKQGGGGVFSIFVLIQTVGFMLEIFFEEGLIRLSDSPDVVGAFLAKLKVIEAAGGVVRNEKGEVLWIYRRGRWDLPKGKVDKWTSGLVGQWAREKEIFHHFTTSPLHHLRSEAVREVKEETGLRDVEVGALIEPTLHLYPEPEKYVKKGEEAGMILKVTWWFEMFADSNQELRPEEEEDITRVCWVAEDQMGPMVEDTFGNIRRLMGG